MRAAVDHNVWVSALLKPQSSPGQVIVALRTHRFALVVREPLLRQLKEVLGRRKFARRGVTSKDTDELLALLADRAEEVEVTGQRLGCRDPDDDLLIETALRGAADVLVSGDQDLMAAGAILAEQGVRVLSAVEFLQALVDEENKLA